MFFLRLPLSGVNGPGSRSLPAPFLVEPGSFPVQLTLVIFLRGKPQDEGVGEAMIDAQPPSFLLGLAQILEALLPGQAVGNVILLEDGATLAEESSGSPRGLLEGDVAAVLVDPLDVEGVVFVEIFEDILGLHLGHTVEVDDGKFYFRALSLNSKEAQAFLEKLHLLLGGGSHLLARRDRGCQGRNLHLGKEIRE